MLLLQLFHRPQESPSPTLMAPTEVDLGLAQPTHLPLLFLILVTPTRIQLPKPSLANLAAPSSVTRRVLARLPAPVQPV